MILFYSVPEMPFPSIVISSLLNVKKEREYSNGIARTSFDICRLGEWDRYIELRHYVYLSYATSNPYSSRSFVRLHPVAEH